MAGFMIDSGYGGGREMTNVSMPKLDVGGSEATDILKALLATGPQRPRRPMPRDNAGSSRNITTGQRNSEYLKRKAMSPQAKRGWSTSRSIPMIPADMFGPSRIDWERVASGGPEYMAAVKAAMPDFLG